ncbi:MAG: RsmB/NOP family class I SAM-dependent RNA methyltransferase [Rhodothermales bacterium]
MPVFPDAFLDRLRTVVPPEHLDATLASFSAPQATGFRVNTLRAESADVIASLEAEGVHPHAVDGLPDGYWVPAEQRAALLASAAYAEDRIYVQNLASQLPPVVLDPQPGERVLDLCAAPGSKTRQLACLMHDEGEIAAVESVRGRFFKLRANLEAQGTTIVRTFHRDGATVWHHRPEHFDRVLLDAPCSTEGRFRTDEPETFAYWSERKVKEMARKQKKLLFSAIQSLRPGGTLVYSTCTFAPEENEVALERMLRKFDGRVEAVPVVLPPSGRVQPALAEWKGKPLERAGEARRLLPTETMEAFFVAKLVKHESTLPERR